MGVTENPAQGKLGKSQPAGAAEGKQVDISGQKKTELARTMGTGSTEILVAAEAAKTLKDAVNRVVLLYSYARKGDVHEFVEAYIWRPVATMTQIFGTADLKIEAVEEWRSKWVRKGSGVPVTKRFYYEGAKIAMPVPGAPGIPVTGLGEHEMELSDPSFGVQKGKLVKKEYKETVYKVTQGTEGFHSRAFGDHDNLFGLVTPNVKKVLGLSRRSEKMLAKLDTRKEKRQAVRAYVAALEKGKGVRG